MVIPKHVAIIVDGNRRWAKNRGLPSYEGHRKGVNNLVQLIKKAKQLGIKIFTCWVFSTENWRRSRKEVSYLMNLFDKVIDQYIKTAIKEKIRIIHLGRKDRLDKHLSKKIVKAEKITENFDKRYLCIALDYGGRDEIIRAVKRIENSKFRIKNLSEEIFNQFLDTKDLPYPYPDLVIRTSGEQRTSGFMIWQTAYAEYIFIKKYFPDFTAEDFEKAIKEYGRRQRRFGS